MADRLISGSGGGDSTAILWDTGLSAGARAAEPRLLHRLEGHTDHIYAVDFSPDGSRAVTGSLDHDLLLWRVADGKAIARMTGHRGEVFSLAVAPDGTIASGDGSGEIRLWDGKTGALNKVLVRLGGNVGSLRFSLDGRLLLSACGGSGCNSTQRIYNVASGKEIAAYTGHDNIVLATAFSPDGRWAATGGGNNKEIHLWDLHSGKPWPGPDGKPLRLAGQGRTTWAAGFSADGRRIGWGTDAYPDEEPNPAYSGEEIGANNRAPFAQTFTLPLAGGALGAPVAHGKAETGTFRRALASVGRYSLRDLSLPEGGNGYVLDIEKDGHSLVSIVRDGTDGYDHRSYSFTPDGKTVVSGGSKGMLTAYTLAGKSLGNFVGHEGDIWAVTPSPDGRFLVSGAANQTVRLWNLKTRELLVTLYRGQDGEWVMWTPEGFYTGSPGADSIVGWQINQGPDKEARYVTAGQLRKALHRPDLVAAKIAGDPEGLVKAAAAKLDVEELIRQSQAPTVAIVSPGDGAFGKEFAEGGSTRVRVTVAARITDTGGGIGRISFRLNGQSVGGRAYGSIMLDKDGVISRSFDLAAPDTVIEVIAEDT